MNTNTNLNEIKSLSEDQLVETNEGTHGHPDNYRIYERLDGSRYTTGPDDPKNCNGYPRAIRHLSPEARRARINALTAVLARSETEHEARSRRVEQLARGWDGYQFVGVEEGRRIAASLNNA